MSKMSCMGNLLDLDWTKSPYILILILSFIISRIPFLNLGFGTDPDAWRIAISAFNLNYFHIYTTSRFPGYPVPEYFNSLIINYGWLATNTATMVISLISVIVFAKILKELKIKNKGLLVITYAFLPIVWINSINTMDYMWAMSFIMLTWFFIIKKQYAFAGLMMGLAVGSRITSGILILPFIYLILIENEKKTKEIAYFICSIIISVIILFLPLFIQYGAGFLSYYPTVVSTGKILEDLNQLGLLALLFGTLIFLVSAKKLIKNIQTDKITVFLIFTVGLVSVIYMGAPYEVGYLIPAIPFGLILLNNISKRKLFVIFCALLLLNSFISFGLLYGANVVEEGVLIKDADIRSKLTDVVGQISTSNINNSIVISAEYFPIICYLYEKSQKKPQIIEMDKIENDYKMHWNTEKKVGYVYVAPQNKIDYWQKKGYKIYYMGSSAMAIIKLYYKYNITDYNCSNAFDLI